MRKNTSIIYVIALISLNTLSMFSIVTAEETRHPKNIVDLVDAGFRGYREFIKWLNYTGLASKFNINLSNVKEVVSKSSMVINEVYNNATLSMFLGAIQLRQLKMFTQSTDYIGQRDIVNLLKVVALKLNISKVDLKCRDLFSKLFINLVQPGFCNYTLTDLDHLTWYIMKLGGELPIDRLTSVLGKVYTMKIAMRTKAISREALNSLLDELLYRESIVVYLILNDVVKTNKITVVSLGQETPKVILTKELTLYNKSSDNVLTFEDLEKAFRIVFEILRLSEKYGLSLTSEDIINVISYILSLDVEEALAILRSIDENYIKYLGQPQIRNDENNVTSTHSNVDEEEGQTFNTIPMILPDEFHDYYREFYEEFLQEITGTYNDRLNKDVREESNVIDLDAYLTRIATSELLHNILERINTPILFIHPLTTGDTSLNTVTQLKRFSREMQISNKFSTNLLWIYLILLLTTSIGIAFVFKPHAVLKVLMKVARIIKGSKVDVHAYNNTNTLEYFWVLMHKLASLFGLQIVGSDTHREAYAKVVSKLDDKDLIRRLEDITKGYEVLRFSDKPYVDKDLWTKYVTAILKKYE